MRWRVITCAACALACTATALAQAPRPNFAPTKDNAARLRWLDYKMMAGRIVATSSYPPGMNISFGPTVSGPLRERLQILILEDRASVQYELEGGGQQLSIALAQDGKFSIDRTRDEPKFAMHFLQPPDGRLSLSVCEGDVERRLEADSFWHLYVAEPGLVRRHLIPDLELLRPGWQLAATGWAIEEALLLKAQKPRPLDIDRWARLVDDLASPKFSTRQKAQRELLEIGQVILPYLQGLDAVRLDAEQLSRVRTLIDTLSVGYEDTTDRIATWLVADQQNWLSLLNRDDEMKRRVAARQLERITGRSIQFDPSADPATRRGQIEKLRARLDVRRRRPGRQSAPTRPRQSHHQASSGSSSAAELLRWASSAP
jgi:hypothetical protein